MARRLLYLFLLIAFWMSLKGFPTRQVQAEGSLSFLGVTPGEPLFQESINPGACLERVITALNESRHKLTLSLSGRGTDFPSYLNDYLLIDIDSAGFAYNSTLGQFLTRRHPLELGRLDQSQTQEIKIRLCLSETSGNDLQQLTSNFDLCFSGKKATCFTASRRTR